MKTIFSGRKMYINHFHNILYSDKIEIHTNVDSDTIVGLSMHTEGIQRGIE